MNPKNLLLIGISLVVALAGCDPQGDSPASSAAPTTTTETTSTSTQGTSTTTEERLVESVDCAEAPETVVIVCETYELIAEHYVDEVDDATLAAAATQGLKALDGADGDEILVCPLPSPAFTVVCDLAAGEADDSEEAARAIVNGLTTHALDPNSVYLDARALDLLQEEQEGAIEGIGALVSPEDRTKQEDERQCSVISETCLIYIVSTIEGAPADAVGLMRDDIIMEVDGRSIVGWSVDAVTAAVRGPAGSDVTLTLERQGELIDVLLTRAEVVIPIIESELFGDIGYIKLSVFTQNADEQFKEALIELLSSDIDELVIDLRNNPGGLLDTAVEITSAFLPDGVVVLTEGPGQSISYEVTGASIVPEDVELVFVVNKGSASASEVVSAALQERGRASVVGEATFGKNTVQQRFDLSDGGALKLTIARWLTPGGHDFGGVGVTPDVELQLEDLEGEALVNAVLAAT